MLAAVFRGPGKLEVVGVATPELGPGDPGVVSILYVLRAAGDALPGK